MRTTTLPAALLGLLVLGFQGAAAAATDSVSAPAAAAADDRPADPAVWGVLAQLRGVMWKRFGGGIAVEWGAGEQMRLRESALLGSPGEILVWPTGPGRLRYRNTASGNELDGEIQSDGSIVWKGRGTLVRYRLDGDRLLIEHVEPRGGGYHAYSTVARYTGTPAVTRTPTATAPAAPAPPPAAAPATAVAAAAPTRTEVVHAVAADTPAPLVQPDTPEVALLRSVIEGLRSGQVPYDRMDPSIVDAVRAQMAKIGPQWAQVEQTRWIESNWPLKPYRFLAMHGDQPAEWRMEVGTNGRIMTINYRSVTVEHVTAVRNFGTLAALAGKSFVHHNTRASFQLEQDGRVLLMAGNWGTVRIRRNGEGGLDVQTGPGHRAKKALATMNRDGALELELFYSGLQTRAQVWRHRISANADGSGFRETQHHRMAGITLVDRDYSLKAENWFVPLNDKTVAEQQRYAAEARAERARQRAEAQASRGEAFAGFLNGLQQAGQQYQQQQAQTRAFNAELQRMTRAAQERQRLEQEAQQRAREVDRRRAEAARLALSESTVPAPTTSSRSSSAVSGSTSAGPARPAASTSGASALTRPAPASTSRAIVESTSSPSPGDGAACRMLPGKTVTQRSIPLSSRESAEAHVRGGASGACPAAYGKGTLGAITCTSESDPIVTVDGKGRTQKTGTRTMYTCSAPVTCPPVEQCQSRPAGGSRQ